MKKILSILILTVAFWSCESDVKFSDPGFQGRKDNFAWRADITTASFQSDGVDPNIGTLTIEAYRGLERVTLTVPFDRNGTITKFNPVTYSLGPTADVSDDITATYDYTDSGFELVYSTDTGEEPDGDSVGNATISLNEYDIVKQTISGTFKFNAKYVGESTVVNENVNFQEGVFYHIPIQ